MSIRGDMGRAGAGRGRVEVCCVSLRQREPAPGTVYKLAQLGIPLALTLTLTPTVGGL